VNDTLYPEYVHRHAEEEQIRSELAKVRSGGSRAVLLYGSGGVGKTRLLRALVRRGRTEATDVIWLDPIDVDDSEFWLLSNLERRTVEQLDPNGRWFREYRKYLSELPRLERVGISYDTVVSRLARIKGVFKRNYTDCVRETGAVVVITLDTVEAVRGMDLLLSLTQWMKSLPATLFLLSGRPPTAGEGAFDPIRDQLEDPHQHLPVKSIHLGPFDIPASLKYLNKSAVGNALDADEKLKIAHLTQGHPLWLAITLDYLADRGMLTEVEHELPHPGDMTEAGVGLHEAFKRRLVTPYRDTDFWHETTKRLAVVRRNVSRPIWEELMQDLPRPTSFTTWEGAWGHLLGMPWIRPRANRHYVTLHDAFAEELAKRIVPVHDQGRGWRRGLWKRAVEIYGRRAEEINASYTRERAALDEIFRLGETAPAVETATIMAVERLSRTKRELDQLRVARLHYLMLLDPERGAHSFLRMVQDARRKNDVSFRSLVTTEMRRFLPGADRTPAVAEAIVESVTALQTWLTDQNRAAYVEIGVQVASQLMDDEQWAGARAVLAALPINNAPPSNRYRVYNLLGNTYMRLPGRVREGHGQFLRALSEADNVAMPEQRQLKAEAQKELGFYFRNVGLWRDADRAYGEAHALIQAELTSDSPAGDQAELASIRTNWAYVKGLLGARLEGHELVRSAIRIRQRHELRDGEGIAWSVAGELHRFYGEYDQAWDCYLQAEQLFHAGRSWHWLGQIYQQQAICLHQATSHDSTVQLVDDPTAKAEQLIRLALDYCRDQAIRGYPSALNRAGRILGCRDRDEGLECLRQGIEQARALSDGWFLFANLVEFAELSYDAWRENPEDRYLDQIRDLDGEVDRVSQDYDFPYLAGRWKIVQGHLMAWQAVESGAATSFAAALEQYSAGFELIAEGNFSSQGVTALSDEFAKFHDIFGQLPQEVRRTWERNLRKKWSNRLVLLARLEDLY
jgi:tetratricopeptide (TPR) repeat protein